MDHTLLTNSVKWMRQPQWLFASGSLVAAGMALVAEGGDTPVTGICILFLCVAVNCLWALTDRPSLEVSAIVMIVLVVVMGWTAGEPESAIFQLVLLAVAVGWRVERFSVSLTLMVLMAISPCIGVLGLVDAEWGWWNWTTAVLFTWTMGRIIRLLEITLTELTSARSKLVDVAAREERRRISRDVHDLVGHSLTAMLLNIRAARRTLPASETDALQALRDAEEIGTTGIADIRAAMADLRSDVITGATETADLTSQPDGEAIKRLLDRQDHIQIVASGEVDQLRGPLAVALYRILQECITNITKHSDTGCGALHLSIDESGIRLDASNPVTTGSISQAGLTDQTLGLISMRERVSNLGGTFNTAAVGGNWQLTCRIPARD